MHLFLLRHADADTEAAHDDDRRLSEKGIAQAERVARFCEAHGFAPEIILTSPVRRAHETAKIVAGHLRAELIVVPWLSCGMRAERALDELEGCKRFASVMLVGHEPDFSMLAAHLLGIPAEHAITIKKASLSQFELGIVRAGFARLEFLVPSRLM